jgi:hypothetical protein
MSLVLYKEMALKLVVFGEGPQFLSCFDSGTLDIVSRLQVVLSVMELENRISNACAI